MGLISLWRAGRAGPVTPRSFTPGVSAPENNHMLLSVSSTNARYFVNELGAPVVMFGHHTWYNIQDGGSSDPPPSFNWSEFLQSLLDYGCNATKLWASLESPRGWSHDNNQWIVPMRYPRTGPGNGNDGKAKFDLAQIDQDYLDRLRTRTEACEAAGIYAIIQLFQGWQVENGKGSPGTGTPGLYHPYNTDNNINSLNPDDNSDDDLRESQYATSNPALAYQEALVEAIIDEIGHCRNVLFEICNEPTGSTENTNWQVHLINHIRAYEATKPLQHPVGMTVQWPNGSNAALDSSGADWVSYNGDKADIVHSASDPVSFRDSDHVEGLAAENAIDWIWQAVCNGHGGALFMDAWDGAMFGVDWRGMPGYVVIRENLGYAHTLVGLLNNILLMTPQAALSTTNYCLARNHATAGEYIAYQPGSGAFNLNLSTATGTLNIRWLRCSDGTVQDTATVSGGDVRTLTPPWAGEVVAYVRHS